VTTPWTATRETLELQGRERTFTLVVPESAPASPPLFLLFHGSQQSSRVFRKFTAGTFDELAVRAGVVLAYPDGVGRHFNDARRGADFECRRLGVDDVAFTAGIIRRLARTHGADRERVYAAGYSNGGQMVIRLLHDAPKLLAGAAVVAATQPAPENFAPAHPHAAPHPVPLLAVHGTADPLAPYDGGEASLWGEQSRGRVLSAPDSAAYFARRNGHEGPPRIEERGEGVVVSSWAEEGRAPVQLWTVRGMGHLVPAPHDLPASLGPGTRAFTAAEAIGGFLGLCRGAGREVAARSPSERGHDE
jgi:polyhydroxybutyrate depolymerase